MEKPHDQCSSGEQGPINSFDTQTTQHLNAGGHAGTSEPLVIPVLAEQAQVHLQREHAVATSLRREEVIVERLDPATRQWVPYRV